MIWTRGDTDPLRPFANVGADAVKKLAKKVQQTIPDWPGLPHLFTGGPKHGHTLIPNDAAQVIFQNVCGFYDIDDVGRFTHIYRRVAVCPDCKATGLGGGFIYSGKWRTKA